MADKGHSERPSFATFWKRTTRGSAAAEKKIRFVPSTTAAGAAAASTATAGDSDGSPGAAADASDRAQIRRAQVRKAQIQHRQRKANYVKQLEMDVSGLRERIATADRDRRVLRAQNDEIRTVLDGSLTPFGLPALPLAEPPPPSLFADIDIDELAVGMELDDQLGSPIFQVRSSSSSEHSGYMPDLTPEQTNQAINFVLALEHICWNHFGHGDFRSFEDIHDHDEELLEKASGHTMMATSLALRTAPQAVFDTIAQTDRWLKDRAAAAAAAAARLQNPAASPPAPPLHDVSWQTSGLTLQSLRGLAKSLNPSDKELAPVQAWFELASQYPPSLLLRDDVIRELKSAFAGVVKCIQFGAVIERKAFESIVGRVIWPQLAGHGLAAGPMDLP